MHSLPRLSKDRNGRSPPSRLPLASLSPPSRPPLAPSLRKRAHLQLQLHARPPPPPKATACLEECGLPGSGGFNPHPSDEPEMVAWELRKYQLQLGYDTVPRFLELYKEGLKDKLAADDSGASELATLLYSDSGPLNVVVELWRHETMQRAQDSRKASRKATKWRSAINEIAKLSTSFDTRFMRPMRFSPWR